MSGVSNPENLNSNKSPSNLNSQHSSATVSPISENTHSQQNNQQNAQQNGQNPIQNAHQNTQQQQHTQRNLHQQNTQLNNNSFSNSNSPKNTHQSNNPSTNQTPNQTPTNQNLEIMNSPMSNNDSEHEPELRDLLIRALERSGVLSGVRAQLRSSVYTIIDQERQKLRAVNDGLSEVQEAIVESLPNRVGLALVQDFLEKLNLPYTRRLLDVEISLDEIDIDPNNAIFLPDFNIPPTTKNFNNTPVLSSLIETKCLTRHPSTITSDFNSSSNSITTMSDCCDELSKFPATRHLPRNIIQFYVDIAAGEMPDSEFRLIGARALELICEHSSKVLNADALFESPPVHEKLKNVKNGGTSRGPVNRDQENRDQENRDQENRDQENRDQENRSQENRSQENRDQFYTESRKEGEEHFLESTLDDSSISDKQY